MKNKIKAFSLSGLLSVSHASAETAVSHQSLAGHGNTGINIEQGNVTVNNCKDCCVDEKKHCDSIAEKLKVTSEKLPEALLKRAQRFVEKDRNDDAKTVLDWSIKKHSPSFEETMWLNGNYYEKRGKGKEALVSYRKAVVLNEEKNPKYLMSAGKMARDYGEYEDAKKWLKNLLQIRLAEKKNDRNLADAQRELAFLYDSRGKQDDQILAEKLYQDALHIYEKELGANDIFLATVLDDLARYYLKKGEFAQAEPLFTRCLSIMERTFDENDPNIAKVLADFALLRKEMFQINEADALFSRSLTICDAASAAGKNCDDIGMIKNDAAEFYESQKLYKEAEQRYKRSSFYFEDERS